MRNVQPVIFLAPQLGRTSAVPYIHSQELIKRDNTVTILTTDCELDYDYGREKRSKGAPENPAFLGLVTERRKRAALIDVDAFVTPDCITSRESRGKGD